MTEAAVTKTPGRLGARAVLAMVALVLLGAALALLLLSVAKPSDDRAAGQATSSDRWEVVWLDDTPTYTELDRDTNYVVLLPDTPKTGYTILEGGRNILVPRGHIVMAGGNTDMERRALYIKDATGTVRIENLFIEGAGDAPFDAIAISAPQAVVELINIRVEGVRGTYEGFHGDIVQPFGGVRRLYVNGLTGYSNYQGFYLQETSGPIGSVELRNVNLGYDPNPVHDLTVLLWLDGCSTYPVKLRNVYIEPRAGQRVLSHAVRPNNWRPPFCKAKQDKQKVWWPKIPEIDGVVVEGTPAGGDFVPATRWNYD